MNRKRTKDKHLPQCVYWKNGAHWYVKRGKWTRLGVGLAETLQAYALLVSTPEGGMDDLIDRAMPVILHNKSEATRDQYNIAARILKRRLTEFSPRQVTHGTIAKLHDSMIDKPNMANRVLSVARLIFARAVEWGELSVNPCHGKKGHRENKRDRLITDAEWHAIYAQAGERLQIIMALQFYTGQRIDDVLKIHRSQLAEDGIKFKQKKTGNKVTIEWQPELTEAVERAKRLNPHSLYLLPGNKGKPPNYRSVLLQWNKACEAAGVKDARLNDGRARSATTADAQGENATNLLGHSSPAMTARYLRDRRGIRAKGPSLKKTGEKR